MSTILVTGGAGYVGSVCCERLIENGHNVIVLDDLSTGHADAVPRGAELYVMDYGDRQAVARVLAQNRVEAVFHFAAKALIPESVANPGVFFDINVASAIGFLEILRRFDVRRFVFSSSAAVYGNAAGGAIDEDDPKKPVNSYGESKLMLERVLEWYATAYGWTVAAFRYFNAAGATMSVGENHHPETHVIPILLEVAAGERDCFEIFGEDYETPDGTCIRDYVHVSDIAEAHILALNMPQREGMHAFNIGCGRGYSVREVVCVAEEITSRTISVRLAGRRPGDPPALCASPAKIEKGLGWRPRHSDLREIIRSAWEWKLKSRETMSRQAA